MDHGGKMQRRAKHRRIGGIEIMKSGKERTMDGKREGNGDKVALFIDYLNGGGLDMEGMVEIARRFGQLESAWAYGRFYCKDYRLPRPAEELRRLGVRLFHCTGLNAGAGDVTDAAMMDDIFRVLHERPEIETFVLCTGDGAYANTVVGIRALDRKAVVIGPPGRTAKGLREAASEFRRAPRLGNGRNGGNNGKNGHNKGKNGRN
jgi:hypothetical protein